MTTCILRPALVLAMVAAFAIPASAQVTPPHDSAQRPAAGFLTAGDTVRVSCAGLERIRGVLRAVDSTSLFVESRGGDRPVSVPRALITRLETLRGHPRRGIRAVLAGVVTGGIGGALAGGLIARASGETGELAGIAIIGGGAIGTIVGTSAGVFTAFTRTDRWVPVGPNTLLLMEAP